MLHFESRAVEEIAAYDVFERPGDFPEYLWDEIVPRRTPQGRPIHRRHRVNGIPEMMALVVESDAVHLFVASLADMAPPAVRVVPVHDLPPAPVCLAWYRNAELPGQVARFIAAAEAASPVAASG